MWCASDDIPNPTISPKISAPRACAESSASIANTAAPSASVIPSRSSANGRHAVGETTWSPSHPFRKVSVSGASCAPVSAAFTAPDRTIWKASPIACAPEAHAVVRVKRRPRDAVLHAHQARSRIRHRARHGQRMHACPARIELFVFGLFRRAPARRASEDHRDLIAGISAHDA